MDINKIITLDNVIKRIKIRNKNKIIYYFFYHQNNHYHNNKK